MQVGTTCNLQLTLDSAFTCFHELHAIQTEIVNKEVVTPLSTNSDELSMTSVRRACSSDAFLTYNIIVIHQFNTAHRISIVFYNSIPAAKHL